MGITPAGAAPNEITVTVYRGTDPILITGEPSVVGAVIEALERVLRGPERRVLRMARDPDQPGAGA